MTTIQLGDVGTVIVLEVYRADGTLETALASADTLELKIKGADGSTKTKTCIPVGDGSAGQIQCTLIANDIDELGNWDGQGYLSWDGTWTGHTTRFQFEVEENL